VPTVRALAGVSNADATRYLKEWSEEKSAAGGQVAAAPAAQLAQARAVEQEAGVTIQVVTANQTGPLATGCSLMVDPFGVVIANTGEASGVIFSELSAERIGIPSGSRRS
jgi:predicted amidohydrolase